MSEHLTTEEILLLIQKMSPDEQGKVLSAIIDRLPVPSVLRLLDLLEKELAARESQSKSL